MECWIPLFDIFLNSPCPESEASVWLRKSFNPLSNTAPISTSSFLSLLMKPSDIAFSLSTSTEQISVMWIQTLPDVVQARILSFLAYDYRTFCYKDLCRIARVMLNESKDLDFWVKRCAEKLLDLLSVSDYQLLSHLNLDSEVEHVEDEFQSVPDWLREVAKDREPLFSWLPVPNDKLSLQTSLSFSENGCDETCILVQEEGTDVDFDELVEEFSLQEMKIEDPLDAEVESLAKSLKGRILNIDCSTKVVEITEEIVELCVKNKRNSLAVLQLIEPWNADDEIAAVLISKSTDVKGDEHDLPSHILCSVILPRLLFLNEPSSRVLMNATIEYCKVHRRSAEYALVLPLMLRTEGINNLMCDLITRIVKECLHPAHVSALCQTLLGKNETQEIICLPCHRCLITDELVWTESLFSLLQNIFNHNVHLTQDSVDQLVIRACESAERYSKSLKFCNFLLCFVHKWSSLLRHHKVLLTAAAEKTNTLVTKSILSKLSAL